MNSSSIKQKNIEFCVAFWLCYKFRSYLYTPNTYYIGVLYSKRVWLVSLSIEIFVLP